MAIRIATNPAAYAKTVVKATLGVGVVAALALTVGWLISLHMRGIYAGFEYNDARSYAAHAIAEKYGLKTAQQMRLAKPNVINTHFNGLTQSGQVRVFHLLGPRNVKWCVSVWNGGNDGPYHTHLADALIVKGCKF